jgi:2-polyprenyl-6-methoxyphenol hydroxylase-like FAD-dependent oxidoreductase
VIAQLNEDEVKFFTAAPARHSRLDGHKVLVTETSDLGKSTPRPIALNGETQRLLVQKVGLGDAWTQQTWPVSVVKGPLGRSHFVSWFPDPEALDILPEEKGSDLSKVNPIVRESEYLPGPSGHKDATMFSPELEKQLLDRCKAFSNLEIRLNTKFVDFDDDPSKEGVSVTTVPCLTEWQQTNNLDWVPSDKLEGTPEGSERTVVTARFLLGCDGVRSRVRETIAKRMDPAHLEAIAAEQVKRIQKIIDSQGAGDEMTAQQRGNKIGLSYDDIRIVVDVALEDESIIGEKLAPHFLHTCDPRFPATIIPSAWVTLGDKAENPPKRHWRFEMGVTKEADRENLESIMDSEDGIFKILQPRFEKHEITIVRSAIYRLTAGQTLFWRLGRCLILGDAAHHTPTYMGQGLNQGFTDVNNLTWKLDLVLKGLASDALLDTYALERADNNANQIVAACHTGLLQTRLSKESSKGIEALRGAVAQMVEWIAKSPPRFGLFNKPFTGPGIFGTEYGCANSPALGAILPQPWVAVQGDNGYGGERMLPAKRSSSGCPEQGSDEIVDGCERTVRLDTLLGDNFCLLLKEDASVTSESKAAGELRKIGGSIVTLPQKVALAPVNPFTDGIDAVLIRPDRVICGVASGAESADALVLALLKSLQA